MSEIMEITPAWAQEQLDELKRRVDAGLFKQRPIREGHIRRYARDMAHGKWLVTHQGIAFDSAGNLIDGQNRLHAVVRSGRVVRMMVTTGIPETQEEAGYMRAMDGIDVGASRSIWQALQLSHGYAGSAIELSSVARNLGRFVLANPNRKMRKEYRQQLSTGSALVILEELDYRSSAERLMALVPQKTLRPALFAAPWCWYHKIKPRKAEAFATDYNTLQNLGKGHPALLLYRYVSTKNLRPRKREYDLMSLVANALVTYEQGETLQSLRPNDDAHLWLLKNNWPHAERITDLLIGEKAAEQPELELERAA
ncbi:MAG: hypothetical protein AB9869_17740 [Verrucomicrobiia bacterium]